MKKQIKTNAKSITVKKDPLKEAEQLIERKKQEIVDAAGNRYREYMQKIIDEFGVEIAFETIVKISKK